MEMSSVYIQIYYAYTDHLASSMFSLFFCLMYFWFAHLSLLIKCLHVCRIHPIIYHSTAHSCRALFKYSSGQEWQPSHSYPPNTTTNASIITHLSLYLNDNIALSTRVKLHLPLTSIWFKRIRLYNFVIQMLLHMLTIKHRQLPWLK